MVDDFKIGGAQKVALDIAASADLEKFDVSIFALREGDALLATYDLDPRIKIRSFDSALDPSFSFWAYLKRGLIPSASSTGAARLIEAVTDARPDILHLHLVPRDLNLGILIQRRTGCELVYTQHLSNFGKESVGTRLLGHILRRSYRRFHLIAVSRAVEEEILTHHLRGTGKAFALIENRLNVERYVPGTEPETDHIRVVYVARIGFPKGHDDLLKAWKLIADLDPPKTLVLVGPDAMDGRMQELAAELGVASSIEFLGPRNNVPEILSNSHIGVFPSQLEGLPLALLEKMAMALPVVVSDIPQLTAVVTDGVDGLVFKCGGEQDLAEKITILSRDPDLRKRLGERARQTVEERFGTRSVAGPNEAMYERILTAREDG